MGEAWKALVLREIFLLQKSAGGKTACPEHNDWTDGIFCRYHSPCADSLYFSLKNRFSATANSVEIPPLLAAETKRTAMKTEAPSPWLPLTLQIY